MNRLKITLITILLTCIGLLGFALYLQIALEIFPCPLCVGQRYVFILIALVCVFALITPSMHRFNMLLGALISLIGVGMAGYHFWVLAQPHGSCGVDPWAAPLNDFFMAKLFPIMFQTIGLCETPYDPILGLSIPAWALVWFVVFTIAFIVLFFSKKKERVFFGKIR